MQDKKLTMLFVAAMMLLSAAIIVPHLADTSVDGADENNATTRTVSNWNELVTAGANAQNGDTIELSRDIFRPEEGGDVTINASNITLNLKNNNLYMGDKNIVQNGTLTIKGDGSNAAIVGMTGSNDFKVSGTVEISSSDLTNSKVTVEDADYVNFNNSTITAIDFKGKEISLTGSTVQFFNVYYDGDISIWGDVKIFSVFVDSITLISDIDVGTFEIINDGAAVNIGDDDHNVNLQFGSMSCSKNSNVLLSEGSTLTFKSDSQIYNTTLTVNGNLSGSSETDFLTFKSTKIIFNKNIELDNLINVDSNSSIEIKENVTVTVKKGIRCAGTLTIEQNRTISLSGTDTVVMCASELIINGTLNVDSASKIQFGDTGYPTKVSSSNALQLNCDIVLNNAEWNFESFPVLSGRTVTIDNLKNDSIIFAAPNTTEMKFVNCKPFSATITNTDNEFTFAGEIRKCKDSPSIDIKGVVQFDDTLFAGIVWNDGTSTTFTINNEKKMSFNKDCVLNGMTLQSIQDAEGNRASIVINKMKSGDSNIQVTSRAIDSTHKLSIAGDFVAASDGASVTFNCDIVMYNDSEVSFGANTSVISNGHAIKIVEEDEKSLETIVSLEVNATFDGVSSISYYWWGMLTFVFEIGSSNPSSLISMELSTEVFVSGDIKSGTLTVTTTNGSKMKITDEKKLDIQSGATFSTTSSEGKIPCIESGSAKDSKVFLKNCSIFVMDGTPTTISNSDCRLTEYGPAVKVTVTATAGEGGTASGSADVWQYDTYSEVLDTFTVTAEDGYTFEKWVDSKGNEITKDTQVILGVDHSLQATFTGGSGSMDLVYTVLLIILGCIAALIAYIIVKNS